MACCRDRSKPAVSIEHVSLGEHHQHLDPFSSEASVAIDFLRRFTVHSRCNNLFAPHLRWVRTAPVFAVAVGLTALLYTDRHAVAEQPLLDVVPDKVRLFPDDSQQLLIRIGDQAQQDVTDQVTLLSRDPKIAAILEAASDHEDEHLLSWREGDRCGHVTGASLRAWLKDATQAPVTARMFRTWHASVRALDGVRKADWGPPSVGAFTDILEPIARDLGHTLSTCRTYYVHEAIEQRYLAGELAGYSESVDLRGLYAGEKRCLALVDEHAVRIGRRVAA